MQRAVSVSSLLTCHNFAAFLDFNANLQNDPMADPSDIRLFSGQKVKGHSGSLF